MTILYLTLLVSLCVTNTLQDIPHEKFHDSSDKKSNVNTSDKSSPEKSPVLKIESKTQSEIKNGSKQNEEMVQVVSEKGQPDNKSNSYIPSIEPGADLRLISVISFIALSCLLCICFKMYRNHKMPKVVKKYGERRRRTDVEMRPLPLHDDDEEDETVFDLGSVSRST